MLQFLSTYTIDVKFVHSCVGYNNKIPRKNQNRKMVFSEFNLNSQKLAECKNPDFYVNFQHMPNVHRV